MALATSKRKFYKLLDNLSSSKVNSQPTPAGLDSQLASSDRPIKRSRMPRPDLAPAKRSSIRMLSPGLNSPALKSPIPQRLSASIGLDESTTYAPWSQEQFLNRLETFSDVKIWSSKPDQLNDVQWAKRGWIASGQDEVACKTCGKHMLVQLGTDGADDAGDAESESQAWWQEDIEQDFINKYEQLIVEGHTPDCLWKKAGCKDDVYRVKYSDSAQWQNELRLRYLSMITLSAPLPSNVVDPLADQSQNKNAMTLDDIIRYFASSSKALRKHDSESPNNTLPISPDTARASAIMAICGWTASDVNGVSIGRCSKCFARVGLWLYVPSSTKPEDDDNVMKFDAVTLHRTHCPWQDPQSQSGLGTYAGLPAWKILVELVGLESTRAERRRSARTVEITVDRYDDEEADEEEGDNEDNSASNSRASRDEIERQDKERETRLEKLKRAFAVKNTIKKNPRPISSRSAKSILSTRSFRSQKED